MTYWNEKIKESTLDGLRRYRDYRIPTGGFLQAVLENNLMEAFGRADEENTESMRDICSFVINEMPRACHGSPEKVREWLKPKEEGNAKT